MTCLEMERQLTDLVAFQCVLVALRGLGGGVSDEMLWQVFLAALVEQYGFRRAWYGHSADGGLRPAVVFPAHVTGLEDLPLSVEEASPILRTAELVLPVSVADAVEGCLVVHSTNPLTASRAGQIRILASEAAAALADLRFRARMEEALRQAKLQAESASRTKSLFLANMSHEIRTPMTGVLGCADLLANTQLTGEQRGYLDTIRDSGTALLSLINDILDFSKIEAGKFSLESAPVDILQLAERTVGLLKARAAEKGLRLWFTVEPSAPRSIMGDAMRLRQILVNLLGNAVKFTSEGEVSLLVTGLAGSESRPQIEFAVRDTGPGIPADQQQKIFDSFTQADTSISRNFGGTGLGLAISQSLADLMGGSITLASTPGAGSTFRLTIPVHAVAETDQPSVRNPLAPDRHLPDMPTLRVIVVEDNPVNRVVELAFLRRLGYQADTAVNGVELLASLRRTSYDVIFMDLQMPEMDGLEATRRVRKGWPPDRQPRIIAMTAAAFSEDRARCLEAGIDRKSTRLNSSHP
jgi:signal transduction histidine kinase/CheY-like chemotaxis protein